MNYNSWECLVESRYIAYKSNYCFRFKDQIYKTLKDNFTFTPDILPDSNTEYFKIISK